MTRFNANKPEDKSITHVLFKQLPLFILIMSLFSCSGKRPINIGISDTGLSPCPTTPNCVSSDSKETPQHHIQPFKLNSSNNNIWQVVTETVSALPSTQIIQQTEHYLHAECTSAIFGFVDDLELHLRTDEKIIAVRSASRLGSSDFGVNRKRVENLRSKFRQKGVIEQ